MFRRLPLLLGLVLALLGGRAPGQDPTGDAALPLLVVDRDDVDVLTSCRVRVPADVVVRDVNGDGVLRVRAAGVRLVFEAGATLRGAPATEEPDQRQGIGISVRGVADVRIEGARLRGFKLGIEAREAPRLVVLDADLADGFRQRLHSTPEAEDAVDWLYPHRNDDGEWSRGGGAALRLLRCDDARIERVRVRTSQNGIMIEDSASPLVVDGDASFLSGWGLALWRVRDGTFARSAFDFCVRGYSHGVYNRGQDSAGILIFEQCVRNRFLECSATHGGDGVFGFGGIEALGEVGEHDEDWYRRRGCNDNLFLGNDFSHAAAHGLEMTFSFGNRILENRLVGNAICGIWGGYSQDTLIAGNLFGDNGEGAYGRERGGVNVEHGRDNRILDNAFRGDRCGVHLWWDEDPGLLAKPGVVANGGGRTARNVVAGNLFVGTPVALEVRGEKGATLVGANRHEDVGRELVTGPDAAIAALEGTPPTWAAPRGIRVPGATRPVGARRALGGREAIVMTPWGPWDHETPWLAREGRGPDGDRWRVLGADPEGLAVEGEVELVAGEGGRVVVRPRVAGTPRPYRLRHAAAGLEGRGVAMVLDWRVRAFATAGDPRAGGEAWRAAAAAAPVRRLSALRLPFGGGGPGDLVVEGAVLAPEVAADRFGVVAELEVELPAGRWTVVTTSDDGVRVRADGRVILENWTHHGATRDEATIDLAEARRVRLEVEYFELDGAAVLDVRLAPAR
ncbi:MAG: right-handed parallel beta-helix repeat-containing protein [Planctomycetota bacterium]